MDDNVILGAIAIVLVLALLFVFVSHVKELETEVEFAKQGLVQSVVEGRVIWVKP